MYMRVHVGEYTILGVSLREGIKRIIIDWGDKEPFAHSTAISFSSGVAVPLQQRKNDLNYQNQIWFNHQV